MFRFLFFYRLSIGFFCDMCKALEVVDLLYVLESAATTEKRQCFFLTSFNDSNWLYA